jgi:hypothetical protein
MSPKLPALFNATDSASLEAQQRFVRLFRIDLILIVVGAISTSVAVTTEDMRLTFALAGALSLGSSALVTSLLRTGRDEQNWYSTRAIAESVKTSAWRFMMGADPYPISLPANAAEERFLRTLDQLLHDRRLPANLVGGSASLGEQITDEMRNLRSSGLGIRKERYLNDRIKEQRSWYGTKSDENLKKMRRWIIVVGGVQLLASFAALALVKWPNLAFNFAPVLSALAGAFLAWLQIRRHQELSEAYGLATQELGLVEARHAHVQNEEQFVGFVADAENAISREHTMWAARRDHYA